MPKYIWVAEISRFDDYNQDLESDRKMIGEVILDSTSYNINEKRAYQSLIAMHILGRIVIIKDSKLDFYFAQGQDSYNHLVRN